MKKGFKKNIEKETLDNNSFRKVLYTAEHCQLVLMTLQPKEEIGLEIHIANDQFFRFESGQGQVTIDNSVYDVGDGDAVIVPSGSEHNVVNTSETLPLKFYTIYSPAHHKDGIMKSTKEEAEAVNEEFDGITTEV